jgi:ABC-type glycerol-3-phosphate transport system substrate-binding protein
MHSRRSARPVLAILMLAALVLLTACGQGSTSAADLRLTSDDAFETAFGSVWEDGGSRRIADMTNFEWDGLRIFAEGSLPR